jgi:ergothioneine biosynthesis protein EgtB
MNGPRHVGREALVSALREARSATLAATLSLPEELWRMPYHPGLQPTAWDLAHIGWFAEFWLLRGPHRLGTDGNLAAERPGKFFGDDARFDSARIGHRARWQMPLPNRNELIDGLAQQAEACEQHVARLPEDDASLYFPRLVLFHEWMHIEALVWTRGILEAPPPPIRALPILSPTAQVVVPATECRLGSAVTESGFAFDNERPGRSVVLRPFAIDSMPTRNREFVEFVEAGGYTDRRWWQGPSGRWLHHAKARHPTRWRAADGCFEQRRFDRWEPLVDDEPVIHINAYEAEAFARWRGRRLPTAAEWEAAADRFEWGGSVWEWTSDAFAPYPGFRPGPYTTYSAPWFHHQREVRGGSFATTPLLHDRRYRNFFAPHRTDVFCGMRTATDRTE